MGIFRQAKQKLSFYFLRKRSSFRRVFDENKPEVKCVLSEIRRFCPSDPARNAVNKNGEIDEKQVLINIGRRQVLSFIMAQINMPDERIEEIVREEIQNGK